jgi:dolichol-phosphate mannosyltransferase
LLLPKLLGPAVPVRFLLFSLIGSLGVGVHLATLWLSLYVAHAVFAVAQAVATLV